MALDAEDAAAVDELLTAYHESLRVQTEALQHDMTDYDNNSSSSNSSLVPMSSHQQLRSPHSSASSIPDLVNVAELSVRRVIAMAKQVQHLSSTPPSFVQWRREREGKKVGDGAELLP